MEMMKKRTMEIMKKMVVMKRVMKTMKKRTMEMIMK
jgi:hypothetical protein